MNALITSMKTLLNTFRESRHFIETTPRIQSLTLPISRNFAWAKESKVWKNVQYQREFLDTLKRNLRLRSNEDWYKVRQKDVLDNGGKGLLSLYGDSLDKMLAGVYPESAWQEWRFLDAPVSVWKDKHNQRDFFDTTGRKLGVKTWEDWYQITESQLLAHNGGSILIKLFGSFPKAVSFVYPQHSWDLSKFASHDIASPAKDAATVKLEDKNDTNTSKAEIKPKDDNK